MCAMSVRAIDHVQLAMPQGGEEKAAAFYEALLGIPQVPKPANLARRGGCWFVSGAVKIHLGVEDEFRPARKAHPALIVEGLDELTAVLAGAGVPIREGEPLAGYRTCTSTTRSATASSCSNRL